MVSKALVVGAYQRKLEAIARQPDVELACIVPPAWRQDGRNFRLERAYTAGYELIVEPIRWNGSFHLFYFPGLGKQLSRLAPDVVHVDEEPYNLATFLSTRLALRRAARPLFFTWQNLYRRYPPPFRWLERYVLGHARHAIAGNAEAAVVIRRKGYRGALTVIPQFGVDPEVFSPGPGAQGLRPSPAPFLIGYLGRLVEEKGLWILLEAVAGLDGDWRLELFGHGPLRGELIARAADLGLAERIAVREPLPSTEVPAQLRRLDALVLPSLTRPNWKEQFGRALVEAMACGVPVVGSDSGEIPTVVGDGGVIVPEGNAPALAAALRRLATDRGLRTDLGRRGRARVLERFTQASVARRTVEVYRQVAGS